MDYFWYFLIAIITWNMVKMFFTAITEVVMMRLHKAKWYAIIAGKEKLKKDNKPEKNKIGFV